MTRTARACKRQLHFKRDCPSMHDCTLRREKRKLRLLALNRKSTRGEECWASLQDYTPTKRACAICKGYLMVDVLDASFSGAHISAVEAQVAHAGQSQLPQVALLHPTAHQRHGNVTLHPQCCSPNQSMTWWECQSYSCLACKECCSQCQQLTMLHICMHQQAISSRAAGNPLPVTAC